MAKLSENFSKSEFDCRCSRTCTGKVAPDPRLTIGLEWLRALAGKPVAVTTAMGKNGGNRCNRQNAKAGGARNSQHKKNRAADIYVTGMTGLELAKLAVLVEPFRNGGIGVAGGHIHVDVRRGRARWDYSSAPGGALNELLDHERDL